MRPRWLGAGAVAVLALGGYFFSHRHAQGEPAKKGAHASAVPVVTERATIRDMPVAFSGIGTVTPLSVVDVKTRVDGQLDKVAFDEGQEVHAGDLLAQIDPRPFEADLARAEATRAKDEAQLRNVRVDVARYATLIDMGGVAAQTLEATKAQVQALEATVRADQAAVDTAKLQLGFTRLAAPTDGRVGLRLVHPGSIVHITDTTGVVTVTQMQPISVIFSLPQDQLPDILAGAAHGKLPVVAYTRDGSKSLAEGVLSVVDSQVDSATGQIRLRAVFSNTDRTLWPGSLVSARILVRTDRGATVVPSRAILRGQEGEYAYLVEDAETVGIRPVVTGQSADGFTVVVSGIRAGETVVLDGQSRIAPGVHVKPQSP
jgi:multidrug efflux system membrane fusion protein